MNIILEGKEINLNEAIGNEIRFATKKFGDVIYADEWNSILTEETGEVARECNNIRLDPVNQKKYEENLTKELIQVIATSLRWIRYLNLK